MKKIGLLGTKITMGEPFYREQLGLEVVLPEKDEQERIYRVIFEELAQGKVREDSKREYLKVISHLSKRGAEAVILGRTELNMLISQKDTNVPPLRYDGTACSGGS